MSISSAISLVKWPDFYIYIHQKQSFWGGSARFWGGGSAFAYVLQNSNGYTLRRNHITLANVRKDLGWN